jgi:hypothetical protein
MIQTDLLALCMGLLAISLLANDLVRDIKQLVPITNSRLVVDAPP